MKIRNIINRILNSFIIQNNRIIIGENVLIGGRILVKGSPGTVSIGNNTVINSDRMAVPLGYQSQTIFWTMEEGSISIGNNCGITNSTFCSANKIVVLDCVTIGGGVKVFDTDFHSLVLEKRMDFANDNDRKSAPVLIKRGAFIGAGSTILKGVTIGEKSIIGAGSVVTKNVPDGEIWGGNPARFIRKVKE